jgi:hypothetical protein
MRSQEYRYKAAACLLAAENSKSIEMRAEWLSMAGIWFRLADEADRNAPTILEDVTNNSFYSN